jgi:phosphatidylinositol-bisphosphatase
MSEAGLRLFISPRHFVVSFTQLQGFDTGQESQLVMDRVSGVCMSTSKFNPLTGGVTADQLQFIDIYGLIGLVTVSEVNFITVITDATKVATMRRAPILTIKSVEFLPFLTQDVGPSEALTRQLAGVARLLTTGFYFSYGYDMTNSLQRQFEGASGLLHEKADGRFYWNSEMYKDFTLQGIEAKWFLPVVQGYVGTDTNYIGDSEITMVLISRRSCFRAGTRYNARGIDDEGNVANFIETEQIFIIDGNCFSLVQIRGSVPVFWQQTGVTASIALTRSRELTTAAFMKHIESEVRLYKHVFFVNLLSSSKSNEQLLTDALQYLLKQHQAQLSQVCAYVYFDFHGMCQGNKFYNLRALLNQVEEMMNYYTYFNVRSAQVVTSQKGVFRINCLDCLDRTNVVMSRLAWQSFIAQMAQIGLAIDFDFDDASLTHPFVKSFKNLWADNGDLLSYEYTGTGSTISSVTRHGKQGFKGMLEHGMKSLSRFYQANVEDNSRQEAIDVVLKKRGGTGSRLVSKISSEVSAREEEYSDYTIVTMQVCTWNLGGKKPPTHEDLLPWLMTDCRADILVVAFQEIVKLNARNILPGANASTVLAWSELLSKTLRGAADQYIHIKDEDMFGCLISIFAKRTIAGKITHIHSDKVKTGFKGQLGNKGSVMVRFNIYDTSVCVWNCHLASGNDQVAARCSQLEDIEQRGFQKDVMGRPKLYTVDNHHVKILVGDLNFRIALSNLEVRRLIQERNLGALMTHDQLKTVMKTHPLLRRYTEPPITFLPTYKYDFNTQNYDSSKKQRTPAWCDRVLYSGGQVFAHAYGRTESLYSDHRPVYATFEIRVRAVDTGRRSMVELDVYSRMQGPPRATAPIRATAPPAEAAVESRMFDLLDLDDTSPIIFASEDPGIVGEYSLI